MANPSSSEPKPAGNQSIADNGPGPGPGQAGAAPAGPGQAPAAPRGKDDSAGRQSSGAAPGGNAAASDSAKDREEIGE
jgi:hypothetical protein